MEKEKTLKKAYQEIMKFNNNPPIIKAILENLFLSGQIYSLQKSNDELRRG